MSQKISAFKNAFSKDKNIYLNSAGVAPLSNAAKEAAKAVLDSLTGPTTESISGPINEYNTTARKMVANLVGCKAHQVVFFHTCAAAISQAALGIKLEPNDEIIIWDQEYPSNAYPWFEAAKRAAATVTIIPSRTDYTLDSEALIQQISEKTKVVAISWIQYQSGAASDLLAISSACKNHGVLFAVDAIQGLGVLPFDMKECGADIVFGGSHKWCCAPIGLGFMALSEDLIEKLEPIYYGAMSYGDPDDLYSKGKSLKSNISRYEPGAPVLIPALGLAASINLILSVGINEIYSEALRISNLLKDGLFSRGFTLVGDTVKTTRSPILTFQTKDRKRIGEYLKNNGVVCAPERAKGIRLSPHAFLNDDEIERFFVVLDQAICATS